ncbi:MAG: hypothetical protein KJI69_00920 [Patescibacteria group bacterium]|nr:hypothetical protein [Patescibacteria group bacterium]
MSKSKHLHNVDEGVIDLGDRLPIQGGGSTTVLLHACSCGVAVPWPAGNFLLIAKETRRWIIEEVLPTNGLTLAATF